MAFTIYYCTNGDKNQIDYEEHYNDYENWISNIYNNPFVAGYIDVDKQNQEAWLDLGEAYYGVLVTVGIADENGWYTDLGYLIDIEPTLSYTEAKHLYDSISITPYQERMMFNYLRKYITENESLYIYYEITCSDGEEVCIEGYPIGPFGE